MDINKANFWTVIKFGNLDKLLERLKVEKKHIEEIVNVIDKNGISLLESSIISRKFDIANYLLDNNANINIISNEGCNELHYLAANIHGVGAVEIAYRLVENGADLNLRDKKYGNSAIFTLCQEVLKRQTNEGNDFIVRCLEKRPNYIDLNNYGYSLKQLIEERGTENMKKVLEAIS